MPAGNEHLMEPFPQHLRFVVVGSYGESFREKL